MSDPEWIVDVIDAELRRRPSKIVLSLEAWGALREWHQNKKYISSKNRPFPKTYGGIPVTLDVAQPNHVTLIYE